MSDWTLRLAREDDAEHMPAIEAAASIAFGSDPSLAHLDFTETWQADELRPLIRKGHCLVAHVDQNMVGFLIAQPFQRELHIWEMDVDPSQQGKGIGAGLIRACQIDARNCGFAALTLTTFRDLAWNGPFYQRMGFTEIEDFTPHPRLAEELEEEAQNGLPKGRRCAMICPLSADAS